MSLVLSPKSCVNQLQIFVSRRESVAQLEVTSGETFLQPTFTLC